MKLKFKLSLAKEKVNEKNYNYQDKGYFVCFDIFDSSTYILINDRMEFINMVHKNPDIVAEINVIN